MHLTTAMLADAAQVQGGKLFVLGGGFGARRPLVVITTGLICASGELHGHVRSRGGNAFRDSAWGATQRAGDWFAETARGVVCVGQLTRIVRGGRLACG